MQGKVEIAGVNTAKLKVLKNEETMELLRRTKAGDQEARRELIEGNLRLVLSVIQRFAGRARTPTTCFRWAAWGSSRPSITLISISQCGFPLTACP